MKKRNNILVVAVHPDDETLGCGGTLLKHRAQGDNIYWLIVTSIKEEYGFPAAKVLRRQKEIAAARSRYKFKDVFELDIPTMKTDTVPMQELVEKLSQCIIQAQANILYLPFKGDVHSDHRKIFDAAYSCTKSFRYPFLKKVLMMETISETEFAASLEESAFIPNSYSDISKFLSGKIEIMKIFKSELGKHPFPRSVENIKALATFRGAVAGCRYAESFMVLKEAW